MALSLAVSPVYEPGNCRAFFHSVINLLMKQLAIPLSAVKHALSGWLCAAAWLRCTKGTQSAIRQVGCGIVCAVLGILMYYLYIPVPPRRAPCPAAARYDLCRY